MDRDARAGDGADAPASGARRRRTVDVRVPDGPPVLTPAAASALLDLLLNVVADESVLREEAS